MRWKLGLGDGLGGGWLGGWLDTWPPPKSKSINISSKKFFFPHTHSLKKNFLLFSFLSLSLNRQIYIFAQSSLTRHQHSSRFLTDSVDVHLFSQQLLYPSPRGWSDFTGLAIGHMNPWKIRGNSCALHIICTQTTHLDIQGYGQRLLRFQTDPPNRCKV